MKGDRMTADYQRRLENAERFISEVERSIRVYSNSHSISQDKLRRDLVDSKINGDSRDYEANIYQLRLQILKQFYGTLIVGKENIDEDKDIMINLDITKCSSERIKHVFIDKMRYSNNMIREYDDFKSVFNMARDSVESILGYDGIIKVKNMDDYNCDENNEVVFRESSSRIERVKKHDL